MYLSSMNFVPKVAFRGLNGTTTDPVKKAEQPVENQSQERASAPVGAETVLAMQNGAVKSKAELNKSVQELRQKMLGTAYLDKDGFRIMSSGIHSDRVEFDKYGRPIEIFDKGAPTEEIKYSENGNKVVKLHCGVDASGRDKAIKEYYDSNNKLTKIENLGFGDIVQSSQEFIYDENGNKIKEIDIDKKKNTRTEFTFDKNENKDFGLFYEDNNLICKKFYKDGEVYKETKYNDDNTTSDFYFNHRGVNISRVNKDADGNVTKTIDFLSDSRGRVDYGHISKSPDGSVCKVFTQPNTNDFVVEKTTYSDGTSREWVYDSGKLNLLVNRDSEGNVESYFTNIERDENNNIVKLTKVDADGEKQCNVDAEGNVHSIEE